MRIALLCSLLGLSLAGCGLFQVTVNGKPMGGAPGGEAADPNAANAGTPAVDGTTAAAPAKAPPRDVKLGEDVAEPVVLTGKYDDTLMVPVKVVTSKRRKVSIVVLGGYAYQGSSGSRRMDSVELTPDEPLEFEVKSDRSEDKRPWHVVLADDEQTKLTAKTVVYGNPRAGAPASERQLDDYSVLPSMGWQLGGGSVSRASPEFAAELFATIDERFFVWPTKERPCGDVTGPLLVGEPLLLDSFSGSSARVRRANGELGTCHFDDAESELGIKRPAEVVMPPPVPPKVSETQNLWSEEEFLPLADQVPRIAAYKQRKATVSACWDKEWNKHDPDGKAGNYDLVQYDSRGNVKKIESMSDRIMRKVDKVCKFTALEKERDGIRDELRKDGEAKSAEAMKKVAARFAK